MMIKKKLASLAERTELATEDVCIANRKYIIAIDNQQAAEENVRLANKQLRQAEIDRAHAKAAMDTANDRLFQVIDEEEADLDAAAERAKRRRREEGQSTAAPRQMQLHEYFQINQPCLS
jgi:hypothetical protein